MFSEGCYMVAIKIKEEIMNREISCAAELWLLKYIKTKEKDFFTNFYTIDLLFQSEFKKKI